MLKHLIHKGFGSKFVSAIDKYMYQVVGYYFVDDTDRLQNAHFEYNMIDDVSIETKRGIYLW